MEIVTGYVGQPHIESWQDRDLNAGIFGSDTYVLNIGNKLAGEIESNTAVRVKDGAVLMQGCLGVIEAGSYDSLTIGNGTQGMQRRDLIVLRYEKTAAGIESLSLAVIQGTPVEESPADPSYTAGNIRSGDLLAEVPLYRVTLNGITITRLTKLIGEAPQMSQMSQMQTALSTLAGNVSRIGSYQSVAPDGITVNNNYLTYCCNLTLDAGLWIVMGTVRFQDSGTGYREVQLIGGASHTRSNVLVYRPASGERSHIPLITFENLTARTRIDLKCRQTSGASMSNVLTELQAIRIK